MTPPKLRPSSNHWTPIALAAALVAAPLGGPWVAVAFAQTPHTIPTLSTAPSTAASSQNAAPTATSEALRLSFKLAVPIAGQDAKNLPLFFEADHLEGQPDERMRAVGKVKLTQGDLTVRAQEITHTHADNTARAIGNVRIRRRGDYFSGPELTLKLDTLEGEFVKPTYQFSRTGAGGQAELVEFLGSNRIRATQATYSSCTPENTTDGRSGDLAWVLSTSRVTLDVDANEGTAEGAVIRFLGVPILAAPVLTFPLTDARKSGWLPPSFDIDNASGFELSEPYYWNIAPERDATLTPVLSTRRGLGLDTEFRYMAHHDTGSVHVYTLPNDRVADRSRGLLDFKHLGQFNDAGSPTVTSYDLRWRRVSDNDYWKDFSRNLPSLTPRLYDSHASVERQLNARNWGLGASQTSLYANVQTWQTLRDTDPQATAESTLIAPYRREPQLGVRSHSDAESGWAWSVLGEFNRFTHENPLLTNGDRVHARALLERPMGTGSVVLTPRVSLNAASYSVVSHPVDSNGQRLPDVSTKADRLLPSFSLDSGLTFERPAHFFGRDLTQTLEPRALYVYTPYKRQSDLPLFDSAERDLNQYAIFSENNFTGVDRISDANQIALGLTTRLLDPLTGAEAMRLGLVQKVSFTEQRITPGDGPPATQNLSDLLLLGSTTVAPHWTLDGTVQASAQGHRNERSLLGVRYSPGPWRTVSANYRYKRNSNEQVDLGWQWPLAGPTPNKVGETPAQQAIAAGPALNAMAPSGKACQGTWYTVGRLRYSMRDNRFTNSLLGLEYDAGCWIGRMVAERISVGRETSTRFMFQLELVGLSRLGSSPLRALKDNIPGYQLLRDDNSVRTAPSPLPNLTDD